MGPIARRILSARALFRLARRRPQLALALAISAGAAVSAAAASAAIVTQEVAMLGRVQPLAPAPAPPAPPAEAMTSRHPLSRFFPHGPAETLRGLASWYGDVWNGKPTASGETFDSEKLTAAHKTLPLGTLVRVTDLRSMRSVVVKINDRGTLAPDRIIDLSSSAARELGMLEKGLAKVKLEILGKA